VIGERRQEGVELARQGDLRGIPLDRAPAHERVVARQDRAGVGRRRLLVHEGDLAAAARKGNAPVTVPEAGPTMAHHAIRLSVTRRPQGAWERSR
jgi:hypothetical protein